MVVGIDACNIRQGGGLTHLLQFLSESNPQKHNFSKIIVWSNQNTLSLIPDHDWIEKKSNSYLERGFFFAFFFQFVYLSKELSKNSCDIVFVPGSTFISNFRPYVTISQNMLPFELNEAFRYKSVFKKMKFLLLRLTQSYTFRNADGLIFLTNYAKETICSKVDVTRNFEIIPHGISYKFTHSPKIQKPLTDYSFENPFKLLYVSILSPYKHQSNLVRVVCDLYNSGVPVKLTLIGPYELESLSDFNKVLEMYDCSKYCIEYKGGIPYESLFNEYKNADGFIFASTCENLPIILIEAMSSGLPIISSNFGPMKEVLGLNSEMFFNPLDLNDIEIQLREFLLNTSLRQKISSFSYSRSLNFTWSEMTDRTFKFLNKLYMNYYDKKR